MLVLCLLITALASCKKDTSNDPNTTPKQPQATTQQEEPDPYPAKDFGQKQINVLMSAEMGGICWVEDEAENIYQEKILEAYMSTEAKYNVVFDITLESGNNSNAAAFTKKVEMGHNNGSDGYDYIIGQSYHTLPLAFSGYFKNLYNSPHINLNTEYFYQNINNQSIIENQIYGIAGAYNMDKISMQMVVFFNKRIHETHFSDSEYTDLYQLARSGKWTFADMTAMAEVAHEENGDDIWDSQDQYGFVGVNATTAAIVGSDIEGIVKNESGVYELRFYNDRLVSLTEDWINFLGKDYVINDGTYDNEIVFSSGHSLFYASHMGTLARTRAAADFQIGVLPFPKYDETQEHYRTFINRYELTYIPINANSEISGTIVEYMNYQFYKHVVPAYWEQSMQGRYAAAPEDKEMMALARDSIYEDFAYTFRYEFEYFYLKPSDFMLKKSGDLTSWWEGAKPTIELQMEDLLARYKDLSKKGY